MIEAWGKTWLTALLMLLAASCAVAQPRIVAAENFYGDVAQQVAGPGVPVTSILSSPDEDPHLFEASPSVARAVADATIVVCNGAGYDAWAPRLAGVPGQVGRRVIVVADLLHHLPGGNPHVWYGPAAMPSYARALAAQLTAADPAHGADYSARLQGFLQSLEPLDARVAALRQRYAGTPVTATEPVFGDMAAALGLAMRNGRFQLAVMNGTEPAASDVAAMETDLRQHRVRLLLYNSQATDAAAERLLQLAREVGVPAVGVTEMEPASLSYQAWMLAQLDAVARALAASP